MTVQTTPYQSKTFTPILGGFDQFFGQKYQKVNGFDLGTHISLSIYLSIELVSCPKLNKTQYFRIRLYDSYCNSLTAL